MGFSEKEVGHMTYRKWNKLYKAYKTNFDYELSLTLNKQRYSDVEKEITLDDVM